MTRAGRDSAGFTLIELLTVCLLLGILLTFSLPAIRRYTTSASLVGGTGQMSSAVRLARFKSVAAHANVILRFQWTAGTYTIHTDANGNGVVESSEPMRGPFRVPRSITIANALQSPVAGDSLVFRPDGTVLEGGAFRVISPQTTKTLTVLRSTGEVYVQ